MANDHIRFFAAICALTLPGAKKRALMNTENTKINLNGPVKKTLSNRSLDRPTEDRPVKRHPKEGDPSKHCSPEDNPVDGRRGLYLKDRSVCFTDIEIKPHIIGFQPISHINTQQRNSHRLNV